MMVLDVLKQIDIIFLVTSITYHLDPLHAIMIKENVISFDLKMLIVV